MPDDPRHGSTRGFHAGCREACCRAAISRYEKATKYRRHSGIAWAIPALSTQRRIQALMRLGWTSSDIAAEAGYAHRNHVFRILKGQKGVPCRYVERKTYRAIAEAYERMSMRLPEMHSWRSRTRAMAERNGWPPPLAWDDIDDPSEMPRDWHYLSTDRADALRDLADMGVGITEACRRLHISRDSLERWCARKGLNDVYLKLAGREAQWENQYTREAS